jgi:hypothetical protein
MDMFACFAHSISSFLSVLYPINCLFKIITVDFIALIHPVSNKVTYELLGMVRG